MISISNRFGALDSRREPHLIGPNLAQDLSNVALESLGIRAQKNVGSAIPGAGIGGTALSLHKFNSTYIASTTNWQYWEYNNQLLRAASGQTPQRSSNGTTWYNLGITAPAALVPALGAAGALTGDYQYVAVYRSSLGGQSGPSTLSAVVTATADRIDVPVVASADAQVDAILLYRIGGTSSVLRLVTTLSNTSATYTDNTADANLGTALSDDEELYEVPVQLEGVAVTAGGVPVGWKGSVLYGGIKGQVSAWPSAYTRQFPESIKKAIPFQGSILVLTTAAAYVVTGSLATQWVVHNTNAQQGCSNGDTAVDCGSVVRWLSPDGICAYAAGQVVVESKSALSDSFVAGLSATNAKAAWFNERYILFLQGGTSFASGGYLEIDPNTPGLWKKGTLTANACFYSRTDDALYVAQTGDIKQWEAGSDATYTYHTGDWIDDQFSLSKHWRRIAVDHDGAVTVTVYIDGTQKGNAQSLSRASLGRSLFFLPPGSRGRRISIKLVGTGKVVEVLAEMGGKSRRP